jgi:hypothetical protein
MEFYDQPVKFDIEAVRLLAAVAPRKAKSERVFLFEPVHALWEYVIYTCTKMRAGTYAVLLRDPSGHVLKQSDSFTVSPDLAKTDDIELEWTVQAPPAIAIDLALLYEAPKKGKKP